MADCGRLDGPAVEQRLARLDELLERVETVPGPTREAAVAAIQVLTEVYGEALARVLDLVAPQPLLEDELIGHLLVLHDLHPEPPERRAVRALEALRPALAERGARAELVGIEGTVAELRLTAKGCGSSAGGVEEAVREALLAAAPELTGVRLAPAPATPPAFVPVDSLFSRSGGPA
ncbi:NifU family protein [Kitasatospora sp. RB6PN24]|uniref:NifU family protein n=1 Tax=Kitasatospora humi TaxID=2893891 RepID=UPI001E3E96F6|nr:NifU family protein [Kitasatospora humi]MCC9307765.1 NifU family protein [Kitasatospora humi]